ncbi:hypothetical protein [Botrimarina mediterranea]|uniref:PEP-CTERM protein-sorting domain-containing protein n=1 Tax=Botrimarina mediterranea TaxID=2528022 RepID=A0A518K285_9BACT|nr:hypothetical protein [Botrimarina mediterranea]QDV71879.1 hypothetical protein Spa11_00480 [Botrimarina mediterranea]
MKRSPLLLVLAAVACCFVAKSAAGQTRYELLPLSFTVANASIGQFNGDYTVSGFIETDGSFGPLDIWSDNVTDLQIVVQGPVSGTLSATDVFGFNVAATPDALLISPYSDSAGHGLGLSGWTLAHSACPACEEAISVLSINPNATGSRVNADFTVLEDLGDSIFTLAVESFSAGTPTSGFVFATNEGVVRGSTPSLPILPTGSSSPAGCDCVSFDFDNAPSGWWFDPPVAEGYEYRMQAGSDALFTSVLDFPPGFDGPFTVVADGATLGVFGPGEPVDFVSLLGHGVGSFLVTGIAPGVDPEDPQAFPIKLAFDQPFASFAMTAITTVPEPGAVMLAVVACLLAQKRR